MNKGYRSGIGHALRGERGNAAEEEGPRMSPKPQEERRAWDEGTENGKFTSNHSKLPQTTERRVLLEWG